MKFAHNIEMRVFCKEDDDEVAITNTIHELFQFDFEKEKIEFRKSNAEVFEDRQIKIISVFVKKERHTKAVIKNLMDNLTAEQKDLLLRQLKTRLDQKLHFYIRLDKSKLLEGKYFITDSGDCFHFNICMAAYPHKYEAARVLVEKMLKT